MNKRRVRAIRKMVTKIVGRTPDQSQLRRGKKAHLAWVRRGRHA